MTTTPEEARLPPAATGPAPDPLPIACEDAEIIVIPAHSTPTRWGVAMQPGIEVYLITPCHSAPLYFQDFEGPFTCFACNAQLGPPAEPTYLYLEDGFEPHELIRLAAEWTGYAEAGGLLVERICETTPFSRTADGFFEPAGTTEHASIQIGARR